MSTVGPHIPARPPLGLKYILWGRHLSLRVVGNIFLENRKLFKLPAAHPPKLPARMTCSEQLGQFSMLLPLALRLICVFWET